MMQYLICGICALRGISLCICKLQVTGNKSSAVASPVIPAFAGMTGLATISGVNTKAQRHKILIYKILRRAFVPSLLRVYKK